MFRPLCIVYHSMQQHATGVWITFNYPVFPDNSCYTMYMKITLTGVVPAKKNSKQWIVRGGQKFLVPSQNHKDWHDGAMWELKQQRVESVKQPVEIHCAFYMKDNRRRDLDGAISSILDLFVDAGILEDDDWKHVPKISACVLGIDKSNPHVVVSISPTSV